MIILRRQIGFYKLLLSFALLGVFGLASWIWRLFIGDTELEVSFYFVCFIAGILVLFALVLVGAIIKLIKEL